MDEMEHQYVACPRVDMSHGDHRISWPSGGYAAALDFAAASMLDCFDEPLSIAELATDVAAATELERTATVLMVKSLVNLLVRSGHLHVYGQSPPPASFLYYPPRASP